MCELRLQVVEHALEGAAHIVQLLLAQLQALLALLLQTPQRVLQRLFFGVGGLQLVGQVVDDALVVLHLALVQIQLVLHKHAALGLGRRHRQVSEARAVRQHRGVRALVLQAAVVVKEVRSLSRSPARLLRRVRQSRLHPAARRGRLLKILLNTLRR